MSAPMITMVKPNRCEPWKAVWPRAAETEQQSVQSQGLKYNFEKGEKMVLDGSAKRGHSHVDSRWKVEAESNAPLEKDEVFE